MGSLLPGAVNEGIRYLAAILATAAIRWTLNDLKRLNKSQLYAPIVAFCTDLRYRYGDEHRQVDKPNVDGMRRSVIMRLDFASKTLSDVSSCVDEVSKKLKQISVSDLNQVYQKTATSVCGRCGLKGAVLAAGILQHHERL